jgi:hypothetical protein
MGNEVVLSGRQVVNRTGEEQAAMDLKKIRLSSLIAASILFLFPWIDMTCNDTTLVTQSGLQATYGGASADSRFDSGSQGAQQSSKEAKDDLGMALPVLLALLCTLGAVVACLLTMFKGQDLGSLAEKLALAALALILLQAILGFPLDGVADELRTEMMKGSGEANELAGALAMSMKLDTSFTFWFYLTLIALAGGAPGILIPLGNKLLARACASKEPSPPPP